ncbi:MAG: 3-deoxy-8-phosphooctulonate synthase [Pseudomonadota bacterium]
MTSPQSVVIGAVHFANNRPLALFAGPCVLESRAHALEVSAAVKDICAACTIGVVYKTSFDKANRTAGNSPRGVGLAAGIEILAEVKQTTGLPILTDVHLPEQCAPIAEVADVLQIPAFLCRQTDLLVAAAKTGKPVKVKKGQFLAPWDMPPVIDKLTGAGCGQILLTERGTSFGYNTLVCDMRGLTIMAQTGWPVIFDATHSVQQPGGRGTSSGGQREFVPTLARAAVAVGIAGVFIETHPDPDHAPSDGATMIALKDLPALIESLQRIDHTVKSA